MPDIRDQDGLLGHSVYDAQVGDDRTSVADQRARHGAAEFGVSLESQEALYDPRMKRTRNLREVGLGLRQKNDLHRLVARSLM